MQFKVQKYLELLERSRFAPLIQFVKFGLVGISNTAISYGIEMLGYYVFFAHNAWAPRTRIIVVTILSFLISIINSYYWNNRFVFADEKQRSLASHLWAFLKMASSYALTGLLLAPLIKVWLNEHGIAYWLATLCTLLLTVPLNFGLNKLWAFRRHNG